VMKESIRTVSPAFCTRRMVKEYTERFYVPAARSGACSRWGPNPSGNLCL